ncbi:site-specific integrase [Xenorhabdus sp. 12]|uniref:Site-specific integrase n=1 Tax=Xenorhabdus santafensis TaxID=2582833 RepID=A0ABU4SF57_9GAMM|nr:site-specific integrase [Xenorhabdus sp. 12]MDX7989438.1 site-specific integrase [Xenorhabdus sp. 12]
MEAFKFTKSVIESLSTPEQGKQDEYRDTVINGLRLRVGASGKKSFCVTKKRNGKFYRSTLGRFPDLTVEMARTKALEVLREVATTGRNPNDLRKEETISKSTLQDALNAYLINRDKKIKEKTKKQYQATLLNYSGDWLEKPIANISRELVEKRHKDITEGTIWFGNKASLNRSSVASGSKSSADLWARYLRAVYRFSQDHFRDSDGKIILPDPPTTVLSTKRQWHGTKRRTSRIRNNDLGRWLDAVESVRQDAEKCLDNMAISVCDALNVALFTGLRRAEVFGLKWDRVNISGRFFWIDETKNGDPLELPITDTLLDIFQRRLQLRKNNNIYVFPSTKGGVVTDPRRVIEQIMKATLPAFNPNNLQLIEFKCHDARRTFGSIAELTGVGSYILKRLMNHRTLRSADVTQGYLHYSADELQEPAKKIEQAILRHAGILKETDNLEQRIISILDGMSASEKRRILSLLSEQKNLKTDYEEQDVK